MKASNCTLEDAQIVAAGHRELAEAMSFVQVEYGYSELLSCWNGFVDASDSYDQTFTTKRKVCFEFANALTDYITCAKPLL